LSGLDLQRELAAADRTIPIIFITGHGDIPMSVEAMKAGAVEFLTKPFRDQALLDAIHKAIRQDIIDRKHRSEIAELRVRYDLLTQREREVLALVVTGLLNKEIAAELGTTEFTVKVQRRSVMQKMMRTNLRTRFGSRLNNHLTKNVWKNFGIFEFAAPDAVEKR
jgi:FixJ family two-component response regulator